MIVGSLGIEHQIAFKSDREVLAVQQEMHRLVAMSIAITIRRAGPLACKVFSTLDWRNYHCRHRCIEYSSNLFTTTHVLLYFGSTHSFVSYQFAKHLNKPLELLDFDFSVAIPLRVPLVSLEVFRTCDIELSDKRLMVDLIPLVIHHFDVILGMD